MGAGYHSFPRDVLPRYRKAVADVNRAKEINRIIRKIVSNKGVEVGRIHYKKIPPGFSAERENEELLKYNALFAQFQSKIPKEMYSKHLTDYCYDKFKMMIPLHRWLLKI